MTPGYAVAAAEIFLGLVNYGVNIHPATTRLPHGGRKPSMKSVCVNSHRSVSVDLHPDGFHRFDLVKVGWKIKLLNG